MSSSQRERQREYPFSSTTVARIRKHANQQFEVQPAGAASAAAGAAPAAGAAAAAGTVAAAATAAAGGADVDVCIASSAANGGDEEEMFRGVVTIGITSSKRLSLFIETVDALQLNFGDGTERGERGESGERRSSLPGGLIREVIVVDDGSSAADRSAMLARYPRFTFVFKPAHDRGHAKSLNILINLVKTK